MCETSLGELPYESLTHADIYDARSDKTNPLMAYHGHVGLLQHYLLRLREALPSHGKDKADQVVFDQK